MSPDRRARAKAAYLDNATRYSKGARRSAEVILEIVFSLIRPRTVVDIGCSIGTWLSVTERMGVTDFLGIDGDYVDPTTLLIAPDRFRALDLTQPFALGRSFDLVMTLEVAEHLPETSASSFVRSLVALGPVVLFSAAVPYQGGTGHINEQWPEYWAAFFSRESYVPIDCIRPRVWSNPNVQPWYAQNTLLFVNEDVLAHNQALSDERERSRGRPLNLVHPIQYVGAADSQNWDPRKLSVGQCIDGLKANITRMARNSLHWRLQQLIWR